MGADQDHTTQAAAAQAAPAEVPKETPIEVVTDPTSEPAKYTTVEAPKEPAIETPKEAAKEATAAPEVEPTAPTPPPKDTEVPAAAPAVPNTPLTKLAIRLPDITNSVGHSEMWGVQLADPQTHVPTKVVLQKFLRANSGDVAAAEKQLKAALEWRKEMNPTALVAASYEEVKFGGLGYVTVHEDIAGNQTVITWNIYGAVKNFKTTFGNLDAFIKWRTALMELGVQKLNLAEVTVPIPEDGQDPYQMVQVHDYLSVSFLRMDPHVRSASSKTIELFSTAYPELLAHKYFVNVPAIMGWMYAAMKLFLAPATLKKFHPMSSGTTLVTELPSIADTLPKEYGGKGPGVKEQGQAVRLVGAQEEPAKEEVTQDAPVAPVPITKEVAKPAETAPTIDVKTPEEQELAAAKKAKVEAVADTLAETKLGEKPAEVKAT